jgi:Protein of unknown function (DUF3224)
MPTATGEFSVSDFAPTDYASEVETALPTGHAHMVKTFTGAVDGRSLTQFSFAFSPETGAGTYVAMEAFEGSVDGRRGAFNFAHSATTRGSDRTDEFFLIVPNSGTGELVGITGTGSIVVDDDGERMVFDYAL